MSSAPQSRAVHPAKVIGWLRSGNPYRHWQNRPMIAVAWVALFLAAINPPHGTGITVCWVKQFTGLSCPGCGITRSLSCGLHGMFLDSWQYHPFGLPLLAWFLATALVSLLPSAARQRIAAAMDSRR